MKNTQPPATVVFSDNPLDGKTRFHVRAVDFRGSDATRRPQDVKNWEEFHGALLMVGYGNKLHFEFCGTAFLVAPGVALTATHVIGECMELLQRGVISLCGIGLVGKEATYWRATRINYDETDVSLLSLIPQSKLPPTDTYYQFPLSTRVPQTGETLTLLGFRQGRLEGGPGNEFTDVHCDLFASKGTVVGFYPNGHPNLGRYHFPIVEIDAGAFGGMSGGVALTEDGYVAGVIAGSLETEDQLGPTYISWISPYLGRRTEVDWPPGLHKGPVSLLEMSRCTYIEGREAVRLLDNGSTETVVWHKKEAPGAG